MTIRIISAALCAIILLISSHWNVSEVSEIPVVERGTDSGETVKFSVEQVLADLDAHRHTKLAHIEFGSMTVADMLSTAEQQRLFDACGARKYLDRLGLSKERLASLYLLRFGLPPDPNRVQVREVLEKLELDEHATIRDLGEALFGSALDQN